MTRSTHLVADTRRAISRLVGDLAAQGDTTLDLVAVCRELSTCLEDCFARAVSEARAVGFSWEDIARAIPGFVCDGEADALGLYELVAAGGVAGDAAYWRCLNCGGLVRDLGPFDAHPVDLQEGHAKGCRRFLEEAAAYLARRAQT